MTLLHKKSDNLDEWYKEVIHKADLIDSSPVKGCSVLKAYCYSIWENIRMHLDSRLKEIGFSNTYFPLFIPADDMKKHEEHFSPFSREILSVGGVNQELFLRPTSEMVIYPTIKNWIKEGCDLPLKINQYCSVVRWEQLKPNLPIIRDNEFLWQESHSLHATEQEAKEEADRILEIYRNFIENTLAIPTVSGFKPKHRMFPGAEYTLALESIMPNMKSMQMATSHYLGQKFSKPLNITVKKDSGEDFVWQACNGITTRLIGAMVMLHGDDKGLVLPPKIAPVQVALEGDAHGLQPELKRMGIRSEVDFKEPVLKGVPILVKKEGDKYVLQRRDNLNQKEANSEDVTQSIETTLNEIQSNLREKSVNILHTDDYDQFVSTTKDKRGTIKAFWCGEVECAKTIKKETRNSLRVIQLVESEGKCVKCEKQAPHKAIFAEAY